MLMPMRAVFPVTPAKETLPSRPFGLTREMYYTMLAIQELSALDGQPPRLRDIGAEIGIANPGQVQLRLRRLRARGYIDWIPAMPRSITIRCALPFPREFSEERPRLKILRLPPEAAE